MSAALAGVAGADGLAFYVLLVAVLAGSACALDAVGRVAEQETGTARAALAGITLAVVVAAASARSPELALLVVPLAVAQELLDALRAGRVAES